MGLSGMHPAVVLKTFFFIFIVLQATAEPLSSVEENMSRDTVREYVKNKAQEVLKEPQGELKFPYIIPSGPYNQLWDWDSVFTGVALLEYGSAPYLAGSMKNFLSNTQIDTHGRGLVKGCLRPDGPSKTLFHAKPVIIQGAWLAASHMNDFNQFLQYKPQMEALLTYWEKERERVVDANGTTVYVWYNQMESGADNLPTSSEFEEMRLTATDIMVFMYREYLSYSLFLKAWSMPEVDSAAYESKANKIQAALNTVLWSDDAGCFIAYNTVKKHHINNRVFLMGFPLWEKGLVDDPRRVESIIQQITRPDMLTPWGIRSTSSLDPSYNNHNIITPYSNWRGPIWIISNSLLCYGFLEQGKKDLALDVANRVVNMLADDLTKTGVWHECYHSENGQGLAAPGFLSWNTLAASLLPNLENNVNPFKLVYPK